jgi:hypothetical protein
MSESLHGIQEVLVVLIVFGSIFGSITAIVVLPFWLKSRERARMQDTVRAAIEQGQSLPSDVIEAMTRGMKPMPSRRRDIRRAVICLAIAGAIGSWGLLDQLNDGWMHPSDWYGFAALPLFIGLAFLVLGFLNGKRD